MVRRLLIRGMLAGLLGALVAFAIAKTVGEPQVDKAIAFEEFVGAREEAAAGADASHEHEEELVTRSQQNFAGLGTGTLIYGAAIGGIFGLVFAFAYGRLGTLTARGTAAVLGLLSFVAVYVMPALKYPATPPAIGNPDTIGRRTNLYLAMIVLSVTTIVLAVVFRKWLSYRIGEWNATVVAAIAYVAVMILAFIALPGINDVPQALLEGVVRSNGESGVTFPPVVLWRFRVAAFGVQVGLWATVAIAFGYLSQRALDGDRATTEQNQVSATA
jgi:hypothetical protein